MSASTPTPTVLTVNGVPTEFIPLPTAWPTGTGCDNNIYEQLDGHFLAWDPYYGASISASARTCLPPEATSWWNQGTFASTAIALGPTFACPQAYTTVTSVTAKETERVYCCPSNYRLLTVQPDLPSFPSQCVSTPQAGETLTWMKIFTSDSGAYITLTSSAVGSATISVLGIPVNGFNFQTNALTTSSATSSTAPTSSGTSTAIETTSPAAAGSSSGPSLGVSVGVSVGVVVFVLALALGGFLLWRRRRRASQHPVATQGGQQHQPEEYFQPEYKHAGAPYPPQTPFSDTSYSPSQGHSAPGFYPGSVHPEPLYEAPAHESEVFEMPTNNAVHEVDSVNKR